MPPLINTPLQRGVVRLGQDETVSTVSRLVIPDGTIQCLFMSLHSYSRVWLHLTWATLERGPLLFKGAAAKVSGYLSQYAAEKGIYMKINYVNPDHVHALIDLPTRLCIEDRCSF